MTSTLAVDYGAGISNAWSSIATFVPKLLAFLAILIIGWIVAKVLAKIVTVVLNKVGFAKLTERSGIQQALAKGGYDASTLLAKVIYYAVLLIALQIAIGVFGPNPVSDLLTKLVAWLPKLFIAIIIIVIAAAIAKAVKELVGGVLGGASYGSFVATAASVFILGVGVIAALNQVGIATTVTTPVLIAVLATIGGVIVVGVGGGLVRPMQDRWEGWLTRAADEVTTRQREARTAAASGQHAQRPAPSAEATAQVWEQRPPRDVPQPPQQTPPQTYPPQPHTGGFPPQHGTSGYGQHGAPGYGQGGWEYPGPQGPQHPGRP